MSEASKPHQEPDTLKLARIISGDRTVDGNGQWSALDAIAVAEAYRSLFEQLERAEKFIAKQGMEYRFAEFCGGISNPASSPPVNRDAGATQSSSDGGLE